MKPRKKRQTIFDKIKDAAKTLDAGLGIARSECDDIHFCDAEPYWFYDVAHGIVSDLKRLQDQAKVLYDLCLENLKRHKEKNGTTIQ